MSPKSTSARDQPEQSHTLDPKWALQRFWRGVQRLEEAEERASSPQGRAAFDQHPSRGSEISLRLAEARDQVETLADSLIESLVRATQSLRDGGSRDPQRWKDLEDQVERGQKLLRRAGMVVEADDLAEAVSGLTDADVRELEGWLVKRVVAWVDGSDENRGVFHADIGGSVVTVESPDDERAFVAAAGWDLPNASLWVDGQLVDDYPRRVLPVYQCAAQAVAAQRRRFEGVQGHAVTTGDRVRQIIDVLTAPDNLVPAEGRQQHVRGTKSAPSASQIEG